MCVSVSNSDLVKQKVTRARSRTDTRISISVSKRSSLVHEGSQTRESAHAYGTVLPVLWLHLCYTTAVNDELNTQFSTYYHHQYRQRNETVVRRLQHGGISL